MFWGKVSLARNSAMQFACGKPSPQRRHDGTRSGIHSDSGPSGACNCKLRRDNSSRLINTHGDKWLLLFECTEKSFSGRCVAAACCVDMPYSGDLNVREIADHQ